VKRSPNTWLRTELLSAFSFVLSRLLGAWFVQAASHVGDPKVGEKG
jgi:hypothetical protein